MTTRSQAADAGMRRAITRRGSALMLLASFVQDAAWCDGGPRVVSAVATRGDTAPGVAGATFETFGPPATDAGSVAFRAGMTIGVGGVTAANDAGIWAG